MTATKSTKFVRCDKPTARRFVDRTDREYGRLTVVEFYGRNRNYPNKTAWLCRCDCGRAVIVTTGNLTSGHTESCGCKRVENTGNMFRKHGKSNRREHRIWRLMLVRCNDPDNPAFEHYGGRGITVCDRWLNFVNFFEDMGPCPPLHSLDREDNDGPYSPDNCRWATQKQQMRNTRSNHLVTYDGRTQTVAAWAEELSMNYGMLLNRLRKWSVEEAFLTPKLR